MERSSVPEAKLTVRCCVAGGGPAGMMLGYMLARAGVGTVVLEKHADFLRDFRGDTIHPSTLEVMHELGLLDAFLRLCAQAPVVNVFADHRARTTNLEPRWLGGEVWGRFADGELVGAEVSKDRITEQCYAAMAAEVAEVVA